MPKASRRSPDSSAASVVEPVEREMFASAAMQSLHSGDGDAAAQLGDALELLAWILIEAAWGGDAARAGANAVVGVRMETNSVYDGMLDVVMLGTAVYFTR